MKHSKLVILIASISFGSLFFFSNPVEAKEIITLKNESTLKQAITFIDIPQNEYIVKDNSIQVKGWALNLSGVKEVKIYINNKYLKSANINESRVDVDVAYPGYPNGKNSGFSANIDLTKVAPGNKELKV
ncbi:hypothetical protein G6Z27_13420, partial [Clostridium perfringens]